MRLEWVKEGGNVGLTRLLRGSELIDRLSVQSVHERKLRRFFGDARMMSDEGRSERPHLVLLLFYNRCGSNLLAEHLRSTAVFSGFYEQLNHNVVEHASKRLDAKTFAQCLDAMAQRDGGGKKIYGFKASWDQLMMLHRSRYLGRFKRVQAVHMVRECRLDQAVSLLIANQTKSWTSQQPSAMESSIKYDPRQLRKILSAIHEAEQLSSLACELLEIERLTVTYDQVVASPKTSVANIADFVGQDIGDWSPHPPKMEKQASEVNSAFKHRFIAETRGLL